MLQRCIIFFTVKRSIQYVLYKKYSYKILAVLKYSHKSKTKD